MNELKIFEVNSYVDNGVTHFDDFRVVIAENAEEAAIMVRQLIWDLLRADVECCDVYEIAFEKGIIGVPKREVTKNEQTQSLD